MTNITRTENDIDSAQAELESYEAQRDKMAKAFRIIVAESAFNLFGNVSAAEMKDMELQMQDAIDNALHGSVSSLKRRIEELEGDAESFYDREQSLDYYASR